MGNVLAWVARFAGSAIVRKYGPSVVRVGVSRLKDYFTRRVGKKIVDKRTEQLKVLVDYKGQLEAEIRELREKKNFETLAHTMHHLGEVAATISSLESA